MELAALFTESYVVGFLLLFFRFAGLFIAVPIFSHESIPVNMKASMALFFTIVFYPLLPPTELIITTTTIVLAIISEFTLSLVVGLVLQISYHIITFAGGQISFMMGFSMASAIDPQSGVSMPIISQFLSLLTLMLLFSLDMHHWVFMFVYESLVEIPLGSYMLQEELFGYMMHAATEIFVVGFMIAFPIIALSWMTDIIFGMLMKTMPQFNLLVIGFPIKIGVALTIITATLPSTLLIMQKHFLAAFNWLEMLF
jgi:flagellar biosynthesis protein FliR